MQTTMSAVATLAPALRALVGAENVYLGAGLARYTTWRVGGPATLLCVARTAAELRRAAELACDAGAPWLVLGRGSNLLIDDAGIDGVVIVNRAVEIAIEGTTVRAESGALLSVLARRTVSAGLVGLEWCHDIPGTVGGAVMSNAGANGGAMADVLRRVWVLPPDGAVRQMDAPELDFGYRHSSLRREQPQPAGARALVLEACFALTRGDVTEIKRRMAAQRERRKATQPGGASAGSVFKNPSGESAGRLVESVGLKGARHGGASISALHANFIVTEPGATARDVLALIALMRRRVWEQHSITLEPEVQLARRDAWIGPPCLEGQHFPEGLTDFEGRDAPDSQPSIENPPSSDDRSPAEGRPRSEGQH